MHKYLDKLSFASCDNISVSVAEDGNATENIVVIIYYDEIFLLLTNNCELILIMISRAYHSGFKKVKHITQNSLTT